MMFVDKWISIFFLNGIEIYTMILFIMYILLLNNSSSSERVMSILNGNSTHARTNELT